MRQRDTAAPRHPAPTAHPAPSPQPTGDRRETDPSLKSRELPRRSVAHLPELLSPSYRNRVRKLSPRKRNQGVQHRPDSHNSAHGALDTQSDTRLGFPGCYLAGENPFDLRAPLRNRTVDLLLTIRTSPGSLPAKPPPKERTSPFLTLNPGQQKLSPLMAIAPDAEQQPGAGINAQPTTPPAAARIPLKLGS